jgi:hypothetical protein
MSTPLRAVAFYLSITIFLSALVAARPPPVHPPNCPYESDLQGHRRVLTRCFYEPELATTWPGGYRDFTKTLFRNDFMITDETPNYPAPEKGKMLPPPGNWAKSRLQFADKLQEYIPQIYAIIGNVHTDDNKPQSGYRDENDCLTFHSEGYYLGTLLKPYG